MAYSAVQVASTKISYIFKFKIFADVCGRQENGIFSYNIFGLGSCVKKLFSPGNHKVCSFSSLWTSAGLPKVMKNNRGVLMSHVTFGV